VEFDDAKIVSGTAVILDDSFDTQRSDWQHDGGDWRVSDGVCRQTSGATPALMKFAFTSQATNYTVSVRARKTGGAEGFLVGFGAQDSQNYYWLNLGGWSRKNRGRRAKSDWPGGERKHRDRSLV
jgi:alpha-L-arabinofuranosidase